MKKKFIWSCFGYGKMSHAAAAFILQKSNEVLSIIKAFKRKANGNANGATTTQNDASNSSVPQSKRTTAVNCMKLSLNDNRVLLYDNSDASNSNIYTEIDLRDISVPTTTTNTKNLVTEPTSTGSSDSIISSDVLRILFKDSNDLQFTSDQSETNKIDGYANESVASQAIVQMEMNDIGVMTEQNPYEIDSTASNVASQIVPCQSSEQTGDLAGSATTNTDTSSRSNTFFANISKSLKHRLKHMANEEQVLAISEESLSETVANTATGNEKDEKSSLKKRFKFKFKSGLHLFKDAKVRFYNG